MSEWSKVGDILKSLVNTNGSGGGGNYVKLADGETIEGVFVGKPVFFWYNFDKKEYLPYVENARKPGKDFVFRFRTNFIVEEEGGYSAKIMEYGQKVLDVVYDAITEDGREAKYRIKRIGTGQGTSYTVRLKGKLTPEEISVIGAVPLREIDRKSVV